MMLITWLQMMVELLAWGAPPEEKVSLLMMSSLSLVLLLGWDVGGKSRVVAVISISIDMLVVIIPSSSPPYTAL